MKRGKNSPVPEAALNFFLPITKIGHPLGCPIFSVFSADLELCAALGTGGCFPDFSLCGSLSSSASLLPLLP